MTERGLAPAAHDRGFVLAPPYRVFEVLGRVDRYPEWWPGVRAERGNEHLVLVLPGAGRVRAVPTGARPGVGLYLRLEGRGLEGVLEWYLEPWKEGTVIHAILSLGGGARWRRRRTLAYRSGIRRGLVAIKERLEARSIP